MIMKYVARLQRVSPVIALLVSNSYHARSFLLIYIHLDNWESNSRLMEDRGWRLTESGVQQWDGKGSAIALRVNC